MKWLKAWLNRILLGGYYKFVSSFIPEPYQDGRGARLVTVLTLECGHSYWIETPKKGKEVKAWVSKYLCDTCMKQYWETMDLNNNLEDEPIWSGPDFWRKMWDRWDRNMKGVDRRKG
jgi:hypothetical protein